MSREFGKVATAIWRSKKFKKLGDNSDAKLLYMYLHTNSNGNSFGVYELPLGYIMADLRWEDSRINGAMIALSKALLIEWDEEEEVVSIANFLEKSPITNKKHAIGAWKTALKLPECDQKSNILSTLSQDKYCSQLDEVKTYLDGLDSPIHSPMHTKETETERETQTETQTQTDISKPSFTTPLNPPKAETRPKQAGGEKENLDLSEDEAWLWNDGLMWLWSYGGQEADLKNLIAEWLKRHEASEIRSVFIQAQTSAKTNPKNWIASVLARKAEERARGVFVPNQAQQSQEGFGLKDVLELEAEGG